MKPEAVRKLPTAPAGRRPPPPAPSNGSKRPAAAPTQTITAGESVTFDSLVIAAGCWLALGQWDVRILQAMLERCARETAVLRVAVRPQPITCRTTRQSGRFWHVEERTKTGKLLVAYNTTIRPEGWTDGA